jgi:nucleoside-diphosphate-sugar epimerase
MEKTVLITGINGFLGSHLAKRLMKDYRVVGLEYQIDDLFRLKDCDFEVLVASVDNMKKLLENRTVAYVIHTATFYGRNHEEMPQIAETNLVMPFRLLDAAIKNHVQAFINTDTVLDRYVSPYALTKNQFREWLYFRRNEIQGINMQLEHFYGKGCSSSNFISLMIDRLKRNEPIDLTAGEQLRDFIYYEDILDAYELVMRRAGQISARFANYQVGSGEHISIKDLMLRLKKMTGSASELNFGAVPYRENELMVSETDMEPLRQLGWKPKHDIMEGLKKTI